MKHQHKTLLFQLLDHLPTSLGYFLYHRLQDQFSKTSFEQKFAANKTSLQVINRILSQHDVSLQQKVVVELGSGWVPILPYMLKYDCSASLVRTYDINEHFKSSEIKLLNEVFTKQYKLSAANFGGKYNLADGIEYFPNTDIRTADLEDVDIVVSRFVLEHVPPELIAAMHKDFATTMKAGSHVLHLISPSDHRAYSDSSLSLYDFLKYSKEQWNNIQTKFDYHNRLRLPQYISLFEKDFDIVYVEYDSCKAESKEYQKFKALPIHNDYMVYSDDELTAGSINVLLRKK